MVRLPTLRFTCVGRVVVLVHGRTAPSDEDWAAYVDKLWSGGDVMPRLRTFVLTEGGSPNALQRGSLTSRVEEGTDLASAVVSPARSVGLVVTALSWFFPGIKFFRPDAMANAFVYLGLSAAEQVDAIEAALELVDDSAGFDWKRRLLALQRGSL